jgi:uncharacterized Zn-finger protein
MKRHKDSVHEGKKAFNCEVCNYSCSQKVHMKRHKELVHEGKKSYKCEICYYSCSQKGDLKIHISSVHEGKKYVTKDLLVMEPWKGIKNQFMKKRKHSNVNFVITQG